jgi:hypothetical protein
VLGTKPVPRAAIDAVNDTLSEAGAEAPAADAEGGQVSFLRAQMANKVIKAQTAKVRLQKMKGDLVDRNRAVAAVFDLARRERDSWFNLPPRVAANMRPNSAWRCIAWSMRWRGWNSDPTFSEPNVFDLYSLMA